MAVHTQSKFSPGCDVALVSCILTRGRIQISTESAFQNVYYSRAEWARNCTVQKHFFFSSADRKANKSFDLNFVCQHNWLWSCLFSNFWLKSHFSLDFRLQNPLKSVSLLKYRSVFQIWIGFQLNTYLHNMNAYKDYFCSLLEQFHFYCISVMDTDINEKFYLGHQAKWKISDSEHEGYSHRRKSGRKAGKPAWFPALLCDCAVYPGPCPLSAAAAGVWCGSMLGTAGRPRSLLGLCLLEAVTSCVCLQVLRSSENPETIYWPSAAIWGL